MDRVAWTFVWIVSTTLTGSVVAWFERQSPTNQRSVIAELRSAKACVSDYSKRDGAKDAMTAASLQRPRFYTGISNGVVIYRTVPGIKDCSPPFTNQGQDQTFEYLPALWHGPPRALRGQELCEAAASQYAAAFNRTLATLKPDAFHAACPTGQPEGK
jgi:hypothetical protein